MTDEELHNHIEQLVAEEHTLREKEGRREEFEPAERVRLEEIEVSLDRCWDLLRQRRARREAGLDPDDAQLRDADTVEHYRQ